MQLSHFAYLPKKDDLPFGKHRLVFDEQAPSISIVRNIGGVHATYYAGNLQCPEAQNILM